MRRGSYAVEFALLLPLLILLASAVIDLGQYLVTTDALVAAVSDGARAGALADPDDEDPILAATFVADRTFTASDLLVGAVFNAAYDGAAAPDRAITLQGVADVEPFFGILSLPPTITYQVTVRLAHQ